MYDIIIIGAGLLGGAVARELSRYELSILCLEKEVDVCCGTSKANTGIIHSPVLVPPSTIKSKMVVKGGLEFDRLSLELGFGFQKTGSLILGFSDEDEAVMQNYIASGIENYEEAGLTPPEYRIVHRPELDKMEPTLNNDVVSALYAPDTGRIIPYEYGIALWENSVENGVKLELSTEVLSLERMKNCWLINTGDKEYQARYIINAAGHGSSSLGIQAGFPDPCIQKVKGQYLILDRDSGPKLNHILFQVPQKDQKKKGKGILVTRTVYGNIMIGPDARWQDNEVDTSTDMEALDEVVQGAMRSVPGIRPADCIKTFAGVRPKPEGGDFIIEHDRGFVHLCGIESPGLTASPAIASKVLALLAEMGLDLIERPDFQPVREPIVREVLHLDDNSVKEWLSLPPGDTLRLICRCEQVPEARIQDAISRGIAVTTLDGVKRRTRAGQGRCQGGFCAKRVRSLLAETYGLTENEISQRGNEPELKRVSAMEIKKRYK